MAGRQSWRLTVVAASVLGGAGCFDDVPTADLYAPVLEITNPAADAVVSGVVNFTVNAFDDTGVAEVRFYAGTTLLGIDEIAPYSWLWSTGQNTGTVRLRAVAEDLAGNTTSKELTVTVNNTPQ